MQVFWVSGPVGRIRSFNLSFKTVVIGFALLTLGLLVTGSVLQFLGFRLALEYDPQMARRLGNLHTAVEVENLNAVYHSRLGDLEAEHRKLLEQVSALHAAKSQLAEMLPAAVARDLPRRLGAAGQGGQGGLFIAPDDTPASSAATGSVLGRMERLDKVLRSRQGTTTQQLQSWQATTDWLASIPIGLPVAGQPALSSPFGERMDPLNHRPAMHNGLDFELPVGVPLLASGAGVVKEAGWDSQYGHMVLVQHQEGYASRYAHASALLVRAGQKVERGQAIAKSGNSGRSTGPHLHFEILRHGKPVDPAQYLAGLAARR